MRENANGSYARLLREGGERQNGCRAAKMRNELAPPHYLSLPPIRKGEHASTCQETAALRNFHPGVTLTVAGWHSPWIVR